jgi:tRNA threonylcarbamoyl adenosine modification protein YeaZ
LTVCFSCSSPFCSVALIDETGSLLFSERAETKQNASGLCIEMLDRGLHSLGLHLVDADLFVADVGPGSFIGVRVGVTLAKSFGFANKKPVAGVSAFDLIDAKNPVAFPSKKGEYFVRQLGAEVVRVSELPSGVKFVGYGPAFAEQTYPDAARVASVLEKIKPTQPELLLPEYLIEPSISIPKTPYRREGA